MIKGVILPVIAPHCLFIYNEVLTDALREI